MASSRLTLGVPFYGYDFTDPSSVVSRTFAQLVGLNSSYAELDQVGQIYYNGRPTIRDKTLLALGRLGGVMI